MIKGSEVQWRELFQQHDSSGMRAAAFCRQHSLCPKYFSLRKKQLGAQSAFVQVKSSRKVAVNTTSANQDKHLPNQNNQQVPIRITEFQVSFIGTSYKPISIALELHPKRGFWQIYFG